MRKISLQEFQDKIKKQGVTRQDAAFVCPMCKTVQSMRDFIAIGVGPDDAERSIGFSCIGRKTGAEPPRKEPDGDPCNWTLGGLLRLDELEVKTPDGKVFPFFEVATPEQAQAHAKANA